VMAASLTPVGLFYAWSVVASLWRSMARLSV